MDDELAHSDAAYVLGALAPGDRAAFEAHLRVCGSCRQRVHQLAGLPGLLATVPGAGRPGLRGVVPGAGATGLRGMVPGAGAEPPVPETQLPSLLRRMSVRRRRASRLTWALLATTAAAVIALAGILVVPAVTGGHAPAPPSVAMTALPGVRLAATAQLLDGPTGTSIHVRCHAEPGSPYPHAIYRLVATDRQGMAHQIAAWRSTGERAAVVDASTDLRLADIRALDVTSTTGQTVLRLDR